MLLHGPQPALDEPRTPHASRRRGPPGQRPPWLGLRTAVVALQVAWSSLVGWIGATLVLLPLAVRGAPLGRVVRPGVPGVVRLVPSSPPREAVPR